MNIEKYMTKEIGFLFYDKVKYEWFSVSSSEDAH